MPFLGISYHVRPGHEEEIADIFSERNFTRADTPVLRNENGDVVGRNLGTALFIQHDRMARIVHYEGDLRFIGPHMSGQQGVKEAERRLSRFLAVPRDTQNPEGFMRYFRNARMDKVFEREAEPRVGRFTALRYTVDPTRADEIRAVFDRHHPDGVLGYSGSSPILAEAAFLKDDALVRMIQHADGTGSDDVADYLGRTGHGPRVESDLAPYLAEPASPAGPYSEVFQARAMRILQELSVANPPALT